MPRRGTRAHENARGTVGRGRRTRLQRSDGGILCAAPATRDRLGGRRLLPPPIFEARYLTPEIGSCDSCRNNLRAGRRFLVALSLID